MLQRLLPLVVLLRERFPPAYDLLVRLAKRFMGGVFGVYPRALANEVGAVTEILRSSQWNMAYGRGLAHERLENDFAEAVGARHAIAVASGGVALQMSLRAMGLKPGDEAIHQVDTCSATAMAVMNAGVTPVFADISDSTFMLDCSDVQRRIGPHTRALIATHMWGNPENVSALRTLAREHGLKLIEDACLGLGAVVDGRPAGSWGDVGVFSFGCIKPIQTGEGGMIVTHDETLARELRSLRHWGDRTIEFGVRDATQLAWNGRMSEILAGVAREQLRGYPRHLKEVRDAVGEFQIFLEGFPGLSLVLGMADSVSSCAFTQAVLRVDAASLGFGKTELMAELTRNGVANWHANFELINGLSFFRSGGWRDWILRGDIDRVGKNNDGPFPAAERVYAHDGVGLGKMNFLSPGNRKHLESVLRSLTKGRAA
ncbi:DegT/DnrJ/EryC1/StrS family aminotransferase [Bradyrhizobium sp. 44]|uniref:DegT/DnrJ/EryC1/StrS family aminotransferase n=1 Tax=Bradyrhizobium sp. 44 TaxID=2782675 RepID=UPI001FF7635E|nr:DegT/DnrJ/EryC1/StrS family aminotransferase [Bradyrhizobium sp. 44]MCK1287627.1 DegT/DnrJ/EryC1/StrS family aminotransferase [Bradyrhizobium sp. 44]